VRVAALYDIHGNIAALEAVLGDVRQERPDAVVIGGDVAWGPFPSEVLDRLASLSPAPLFVRGNCDRELLEANARLAKRTDTEGGVGEDDPRKLADEWCVRQLGEPHMTLLSGFQATIQLSIDGLGEVLFCHASPRSDEEILTPLTPGPLVEDALSGCAHAAVVGGHTHIQMDRRTARSRFVNAGSVGMPYEERPGAYWAMLGAGGGVELRRSEYDFAAAAEAIRSSGFPVTDFVDDSLLDPIGPVEAARQFEELSRR
jgi:predicted phosphodiesterase